MKDKKQGRRSANDAHKTRIHILREAASLFCEFGYSGVSLRNISDKAGISHSLIRHHFGSKENIWHSISDGIHHYMEMYLRKVLKEIPEETPVRVKLYRLCMYMLAHGLIVKQPIQFIADAIRTEGKLFDYFIDSSGELEEVVKDLTIQYNKEYPDTPLKVWRIKWQMIMFIHSAASLTPFMQETWSDETDSLDDCLLRHWSLFNDMLANKLHIDEKDILRPKRVKDMVYTLEYDWEEECAQKNTD